MSADPPESFPTSHAAHAPPATASCTQDLVETQSQGRSHQPEGRQTEMPFLAVSASVLHGLRRFSSPAPDAETPQDATQSAPALLSLASRDLRLEACHLHPATASPCPPRSPPRALATDARPSAPTALPKDTYRDCDALPDHSHGSASSPQPVSPHSNSGRPGSQRLADRPTPSLQQQNALACHPLTCTTQNSIGTPRTSKARRQRNSGQIPTTSITDAIATTQDSPTTG